MTTLRSLAVEHLAAAGGRVDGAIEALTRLLLDDPKLLAVVIEQVVKESAESVVRNRLHDDRAILIGAVERDARAGVEAFARGLRACMLDFQLSDGVRVRDALPEQCAAQAERYEHSSEDAGRKARWLRAVIKGVPKTKKVGDVVSAERANKLWSAS